MLGVTEFLLTACAGRKRNNKKVFTNSSRDFVTTVKNLTEKKTVFRVHLNSKYLAILKTLVFTLKSFLDQKWRAELEGSHFHQLLSFDLLKRCSACYWISIIVFISFNLKYPNWRTPNFKSKFIDQIKWNNNHQVLMAISTSKIGSKGGTKIHQGLSWEFETAGDDL